jgi:hypothetical protein
MRGVTVAHLATAIEWKKSVKRWDETECKAMERLVSAWKTHNGTDESPEAEEELNIALDAVAIAHAAATFEWATGPLKLRNHHDTLAVSGNERRESWMPAPTRSFSR